MGGFFPCHLQSGIVIELHLACGGGILGVSIGIGRNALYIVTSPEGNGGICLVIGAVEFIA